MHKENSFAVNEDTKMKKHEVLSQIVWQLHCTSAFWVFFIWGFISFQLKQLCLSLTANSSWFSSSGYPVKAN